VLAGRRRGDVEVDAGLEQVGGMGGDEVGEVGEAGEGSVFAAADDLVEIDWFVEGVQGGQGCRVAWVDGEGVGEVDFGEPDVGVVELGEGGTGVVEFDGEVAGVVVDADAAGGGTGGVC